MLNEHVEPLPILVSLSGVLKKRCTPKTKKELLLNGFIMNTFLSSIYDIPTYRKKKPAFFAHLYLFADLFMVSQRS